MDGPNSGPVADAHVVGFFSLNEMVRLDIGEAATKKNIPASHESWATRLRIVRLSGVSNHSLSYGEIVGVFSEDGEWRLDIGTDAMKQNVPATHDSWATRLKIRPL